MEPKPEDLKRLSGLAKEVAGKVDADMGREQLKQAVAHWVEIISVACSLISANGQLLSVVTEGDEAMTSFCQKGGLERLQVVASFRDKLTKLSNKIDQVNTNYHENKVGDFPDQDHILAMPVPESFGTELSSQSFDDLCSHLAAKWTRTLDGRVQSFLDAVHTRRAAKHVQSELSDEDWFKQWAINAPAYWASQVDSDSTPEAIMSAAQATIFLIPAAQTKDFCNDMMQDWVVRW